jgi:hypothetical protein
MTSQDTWILTKPVQISAAMMADDDLLILSSEPEAVSTTTTGEVIPSRDLSQSFGPIQPTPNDPIPSRGPEQLLSYLEAFHADITTVAHIDLNENRIYRAGCTPGVTRGKTKSVLQTITPKERLVNFDPVNIPTEHTDPDTHSILTALLSDRIRVHANMTGCNEGKSMAGPSSAAKQFIDREFERLEESYRDTKRTMYKIFADSKFIVHDNNYLFANCGERLHQWSPEMSTSHYKDGAKEVP